MHVMQVITYLRFHVEWPANAHSMLTSMWEAITLEELMNELYDKYFIDINFGFGDEEEDQQGSDYMDRFEIEYQNIILSLGIFAITLFVLLAILVVYLLL